MRNIQYISVMVVIWVFINIESYTSKNQANMQQKSALYGDSSYMDMAI